jgi:hypothetical protein
MKTQRLREYIKEYNRREAAADREKLILETLRSIRDNLNKPKLTKKAREECLGMIEQVLKEVPQE